VGLAGVFRAVLRNRDLRRVELAFDGLQAAGTGVTAAAIFFERDRPL
jgi:hypothetical protein